METAYALNCIGTLYLTQKNENAASYLERALLIYEKHLGKSHQNIAKILDNLAIHYKNTGQETKASQLKTRAVTIRMAEKTGSDSH